jgi:hypothetical protein
MYRSSVDDMEKWTFLTLTGLELLHLGRPARSQSPSRLPFPYRNMKIFQETKWNLSMFVELRDMKQILGAELCPWATNWIALLYDKAFRAN